MSTDPKKNDEIKDDELDNVSGGRGVTGAEGMDDGNSTQSSSVPHRVVSALPIRSASSDPYSSSIIAINWK